jgi:hypothetical protein
MTVDELAALVQKQNENYTKNLQLLFDVTAKLQKVATEIENVPGVVARFPGDVVVPLGSKLVLNGTKWSIVKSSITFDKYGILKSTSNL